MADREKVVNGLKLLAHWPDGLIITDKEKWIKPCCEMAVAMLKEQEAVEPTVGSIEEYDGHGSWWYQCGKCKMPIDYGDRFCRNCGRPVKWK